MSKNQHSNKEAKKQPQTTFKEKRAAKKAKYDVKAMTPANVPQLDPVIIIKPPSRNLRFALLCALAGAVVGAFVGALLATRPWQ